MAERGRLPIMRGVVLAYRDIVRVARAMPRLAGAVLVILLTFNLLEIVIPRSWFELPLAEFVFGAARGFLLTPFLIAVHRFIILDEVTPRYILAPLAPRFLRFFGWTLVPALVLAAGSIIQYLLSAAELPARAVSLGAGVALIVGVFVILRLMILFPAIAVDAPGASARNAFADSKGFFWDMFFICLVAMLPLVVLTMLLVVLEVPLELRGTAPALWTVLEVTDKTVVELVAYPLYVAIASRIFHALGERVLHRYPERAV
jgi:hypothetical protein